MASIPQSHINQLQAFVGMLKEKPCIIHDPSLGFFKDYLLSLGARLPEEQRKSQEDHAKKVPPAAEDMECEDVKEADEPDEEEEEEIDLDMTGVIEADSEEPHEMGDPTKEEMTDEESDQFDVKRSEAMAAFNEGNWTLAIDLFTEAIKLNPTSAAMFAKRGTCFLKIQKPNACIRDCTRAIEINPDNAAAHKFRGRAHRLLGHFKEAAQDLRLACKIDFDEMADEWLKEVTPNAKKIEERERIMTRKHEAKELKERMERVNRARKANEEAASKGHRENGGGGSGMGDDLINLMNELKDPEVMQAVQEIMQNPSSMSKYMNNPKVMNLMKALGSKMGGSPFPNMGAFSGSEGGVPPPPEATPTGNDNLASDDLD